MISYVYSFGSKLTTYATASFLSWQTKAKTALPPLRKALREKARAACFDSEPFPARFKLPSRVGKPWSIWARWGNLSEFSEFLLSAKFMVANLCRLALSLKAWDSDKPFTALSGTDLPQTS